MADYIFKNNPALNDVDWNNMPLMDDDSANWLHTMGWPYPKDGKAYAESVGLFDMPRSEQRIHVEHLMSGGRAPHVPKSVREYLVSLGLLDE